jgi:hypothetical protein
MRPRSRPERTLLLRESDPKDEGVRVRSPGPGLPRRTGPASSRSGVGVSDLEARRLVRELFRSGLDAEQALDVVIDELIQNGSLNVRVETDTRKGTTIHFMPGKPVRPSMVDHNAKVVPASEIEHVGPPISVNGQDVEDDERAAPRPEDMHGAADEFRGSDHAYPVDAHGAPMSTDDH